MDIQDLTFTVKYSKEDQEYVGTCQQFPSLSWLDKNPTKAFTGIYNLVCDELGEL